jgi:glycosyltransferase involved in cell wall biosynthesis
MIACGLKNDNYVIIPNVVDMEMFHPADERQKGDKKRLIHVSCFEDKQKNITGILRVIKNLSEKRKDFICDMVGDGIHYKQLIRQAEQLQIKDNYVRFYGLKENEELAEFMRNADLMIMFSNYENLPVVILESYACGVPVISTDVGGIREHLNNSLGRLVNPGDEKAFLESIDHALDNLEEYDRSVLRVYAEKHFSNEVIGKQLYGVYRKTVKHKFKPGFDQ